MKEKPQSFDCTYCTTTITPTHEEYLADSAICDCGYVTYLDEVGMSIYQSAKIIPLFASENIRLFQRN